MDKTEWGAIQVPRLENYRGLVFGNWDPAAPSLIEYMDDMTWYMDTFLNRDPQGTEVLGGVYKWTINSNWKYCAEQFVQDAYHFGITHLAALISTRPETMPLPSLAQGPAGKEFASPHGHGLGFLDNMLPQFYDTAMAVGPHSGEYLARQQDNFRKQVGAERSQLAIPHMTLFPNFSALPRNGSIRVWHPKGPDKTEIWSWSFVDKSAPAAAKEEWGAMLAQTFSPSGMFEVDDAENWERMQRNLRGYVSRKTLLNMQQGLNQPPQIQAPYPGIANDMYNETGSRFFYQQWATLLSGHGEKH